MDAYSKEEPVVKADLNEKTEIVPEENRIKPNPAFERTVEESFISAADDMNVIMDKQEDIKEEVEEYKKEKPEVMGISTPLFASGSKGSHPAKTFIKKSRTPQSTTEL